MTRQFFIAPNFTRAATTTANGWTCFRAFSAIQNRTRGRGPHVAKVTRALARAAAARGAL